MKCIDLNCDLGENFGHYRLYDDEAILPYISSANIACAYHAGDALTMKKTVALAKKYNVAIGAHPALPDLEGFGRRVMAVTVEEAYAYCLHQIGAIFAFCKTNDASLCHVKPHGALYNMASLDYELANAIARAVYDFDKNLVLVGASGGQLVAAGKELGLKVKSEVFADRAYTKDGFLVSRRQKGAVLKGETVLKQALSLALKGEVISIDGEVIKLKADTLCLHGDNIEALENAKRINALLKENNINIGFSR